jgi:iron complex outermembrane receptor protein
MRSLLLASTALLILAPISAMAQASPDGTLEEVVVTAQRREENLQKVAVAVDVIQGADLAAKGVTSLEALQTLSPSLTVESTSTGNLVFLRGVGNFTLTANSDPAISFNYDGIYIGRPTSTYGVFYDLERVEVLKGPQGILYGRNATGGAINILPVTPNLKGFSGQGSVSVGDYSTALAQGGVNIPVTEHSALRLSGSYSHHDGYLRDGTDDDDTKAVRAQYLVEVTPNLTVRLAGDYTRTTGAGENVSYVGTYVPNPATRSYNFAPAGVPIEEGTYSAASQAYRQTLGAGGASGRNLDALLPYSDIKDSYAGVNLVVSYDSPLGVITFNPAYRETKLNNISDAGAFMVHGRSKSTDTSTELRLNGKRVGIFDYTAGLYWYWGDTGAGGADTLNAISASSLAIWGTGGGYKTRSFAPFGSVTAHVTDDLRLTAGVRYTTDDKSYFAKQTAGIISCLSPTRACPTGPLFPLVDTPSQLPFAFPAPGGAPVIVNGAAVIRADTVNFGSLSESRTTFRLVAEYDLTSSAMAYASYETGYRSGGFNTAVGFETYEPEYLYASTLGLKSRLMENRLQLNVEAFYWQYKNEQVSHVGLDLTGRTTNFIQNVGAATIKGIELEGLAQVTSNTRITADIQYLDARDDNFTYFQSAAATAPIPLTGCPFALSAANPAVYAVNCAGKPAFNAPKWTLNLGVEQRIPVGANRITLSADTVYRSSRYNGFEYLPQELIGPDWTSNASVGYGPDDDQWRVSAYIRNIGNERVPGFATINPQTQTLVFGLSSPRTYGVTLNGRF